MENKEEEKKETSTQQKFEPMLDLKKAMDELKIDPKSPDFSEEEMIKKFKQISEDPNTHFFQRDRFKKLIGVLGEHRFWNSQPIMKLKEMIPEGQI